MRTSSVEQFIDGYLTKLRRVGNLASEKIYLEKSIKLIDFFLGYPCCIDPAADVRYARRENILTRFIQANLRKGFFDKRKWRKSLENTKRSLRNVLYDPCCVTQFSFYADATAACFGTGLSIPLMFVSTTDATDYHIENVRFKEGMPVHHFSIPAGTYNISIPTGRLIGSSKLSVKTVADVIGAALNSGTSTLSAVVVGSTGTNVNQIVADC